MNNNDNNLKGENEMKGKIIKLIKRQGLSPIYEARENGALVDYSSSLKNLKKSVGSEYIIDKSNW